MATREYCSSVSVELQHWSDKLHTLSNEIDRIPSINKYRLLPQIEKLHIIMTELDDRVSDLTHACSTVERMDKVGPEVGKTKNELFDYEFGG